MQNRHERYRPNPVNAKALDELTALVGSSEEGNGDFQVDTKAIESYLSRDFNLRALGQSLSYASTVNDNRTMTYLLVSLAKVVDTATESESLVAPVGALIDDLVQTGGSVFNKCLNSGKPSLINPTLRLLTAIATFNKGEKVDRVLDAFDATSSALPKLAIPSKMETMDPLRSQGELSVRRNFVTFWITLCETVHPLSRKDLILGNPKVMSNIFKYLAVYDSEALQRRVLHFLDAGILMQPSYRKMTKCRLVGDWVISKVVELYAVSGLRDELQKLLLKMATDEEDGLVFGNDAPWFVSKSASGGSIKIADRAFHVHNKLIYTMLTKLKPWADELQMDLVVAVLRYNPELVPAYNQYCLGSNGAHDPKLTSFYMGQSLTLLKIIQLPVPVEFEAQVKKQVNANSTPDLDIATLIEAVCPGQLSKSVLIRGLTSKTKMITHISSVLVLAVLQKFEKLARALSYDGNRLYRTTRSELTRMLQLQKLPDSGVVVGAFNECLKSSPDNKLLQLNFLKIAQEYHKVFNETPAVRMAAHLDDTFKGVDLAVLSAYLELTADSPEQNKWWSISKGDKNTLFTWLLGLPLRLTDEAADNVTEADIAETISTLTKYTLVFTDFRSAETPVLTSQAYALAHSLRLLGTNGSLDAIYHVIDEAISRCAGSPYKYIDQARSFSTNLSPFYVALIEQSKFVSADSAVQCSKWLNLVTRFLALLGEPLEAMKQCAGELALDFDLNTYEQSTESFFNTQYGPNVDLVDLSFVEVIFSAPYTSLAKYLEAKLPMSDFDYVSLMSRASSLVNNTALDLATTELVLSSLISRSGNYLVQKLDTLLHSDNDDVTTSSLRLLDAKYWKPLYVDYSCDNETVAAKKASVASLLNEIFYTLWQGLDDRKRGQAAVFKDYKDAVFSLVRGVTSSDMVGLSRESLWILDDEQVVAALGTIKIPELSRSLLQLATARKIQLDSSKFMSLLSLNSKQNCEVFGLLARNVSFEESDVDTLLSSLDETVYPILESVVTENPKFAAKVSQRAQTAPHISLEFLDFLSAYSSELVQVVFDKAAAEISSVINGSASADTYLGLCLKIVAKNASLTSKESLKNMVSSLLQVDKFQNNASLVFSEDFVSLLSFCPEDKEMLNWWRRTALYVSKMLSESTQLPQQFTQFLQSTEKLIGRIQIWKVAPRTVLNSQLETIFSGEWVQNATVLQYALSLLDSHPKGFVEEEKMLQILLNNEHCALREVPVTKQKLELRFYSALAISFLFECNPAKLSTMGTQLALVKYHLGTTRPDDILLRKVMKQIEAKTEVSWVGYITGWEFRDEKGKFDEDSADEEDEYSLADSLLVETIPGDPRSLNVVLRKSILDNTIEHFTQTGHYEGGQSTLQEWKALFKAATLGTKDRLSSKDMCYDCEFLLLLILNNEELLKVEESEVKVFARPLVESGLLQLVIMALASSDESVPKIARRVLYCVFSVLDKQIKDAGDLEDGKEDSKDTKKESKKETNDDSLHLYRERVVMKLFLGNLLLTLEKEEEKEDKEAISPVILLVLSQFVPVLIAPDHTMYEKIYRFLLGAPTFRTFEIPLYKPVMCLFTKDAHASAETDNTEGYYGRLTWFLDALSRSITCAEDVAVLRKGGFFDTLLTLSLSPFIQSRVQLQVVEILRKVSQMPEGADVLVRTAGMLAFIEEKASSLKRALSGELSKTRVSDNFLLLQYQRLAVELRIACDVNGSNKRTRDWTHDDLDRSVQRVVHQ